MKTGSSHPLEGPQSAPTPLYYSNTPSNSSPTFIMGYHYILAFITAGLLFLAVTSPLRAQPPALWSRTYGGFSDDGSESVQPCTDGGFILAGLTRSFGAGGGDAWLIKTDSAGNLEWQRTFGGSDLDGSHAVIQSLDGGYALTGFTWSSGAGNADLWLIKTDPAGYELWRRTYGGSGHDDGQALQQTADSGYVMVGWTDSYGAGLHDIWLVKTDSSGTVQWSRTYGGAGFDFGYAVEQTADGGYIMSGGTTSSGMGSDDAWLVKTDPFGVEQWNRTFGGSGSDIGRYTRQTLDGGYMIAGYTRSFGASSSDFWLVKTDANGIEEWSRTYGGSNAERAFSGQQTNNGSYILAGSTASFGEGGEDVWLLRTDPHGAEVWRCTFGGSGTDGAYAVDQTTDGGYILAGLTASYGAGGRDLWLIRVVADTSLAARASGSIPYPLEPVLLPCFPNPFNPTTTIRYELPQATLVTLAIYDLLGREVVRLVDGYMQPGINESVWDGRATGGRALPSGIYLVRLLTPGYAKSIKLLLLR